MTQSLERQLSEAEKEHGKDNPNLQWLRDQIAAQKSGESAQQKYVVGMMQRSGSAEE
jgi:hypothetical protein